MTNGNKAEQRVGKSDVLRLEYMNNISMEERRVHVEILEIIDRRRDTIDYVHAGDLYSIACWGSSISLLVRDFFIDTRT